MLSKTRSRTLTPRPKKPHFSTKRRKPLNRKRKFHAKDNPFKAYKEKRSKEEVIAYAEICRAERLSRPTEAETAFGFILRNQGIRYTQEHIFYYADRFAIADFYIKSGSQELIIEVDGSAHEAQQGFDCERDQYFGRIGIQTLRFTNKQVINTPEWVAQRVMEAMDGH